MKKIVNQSILDIIPYKPGKPIEELSREMGITDIIKMASNENPLGPSKKAVKAMQDHLKTVHLYPDGSCYKLKEALKKEFKISADNLVIGNGSSEIMELVYHAFLKKGNEIILGDPSFLMYPILAKMFDVKIKTVPLDKDLNYDLDKMLKTITKKTKLIVVCNPNNPTGISVPKKQLQKFIDAVPKNIVIILDEAYYEFAAPGILPPSIKYIDKKKNIVILRTFAKIYGLAGVRVGYGIMAKEVSDYLNRARAPFNVNSLAQVAALAALDDKEHLHQTVKITNVGKKYFYQEFKKLKIAYFPSQANFILVKVGDGKKITHELLKKGVIVRPMAGYKLPEYIRVTLGNMKENKRFLKSLREVLNT